MSAPRLVDFAFGILSGLVVGSSFLAAYLVPDRNALTRALNRFVMASGFRLMKPRTQCLIWAVGSFLLAGIAAVACFLKRGGL